MQEEKKVRCDRGYPERARSSSGTPCSAATSASPPPPRCAAAAATTRRSTRAPPAACAPHHTTNRFRHRSGTTARAKGECRKSSGADAYEAMRAAARKQVEAIPGDLVGIRRRGGPGVRGGVRRREEAAAAAAARAERYPFLSLEKGMENWRYWASSI
uniref:Uncharacterized protein n=1 Tax=Oryza brachyantha TaxID=4533 RepID=J3LFH0_ORYBR